MPTGSAAASAPAGVTVLRAADRAVTRWRNGTGTTSEILVRRDPTAAPTAVGFDWRLSIATVSSDAAFSAFPGVDRSLMALSAAGLNLTDNGVGVPSVNTMCMISPARTRSPGSRSAVTPLTSI
jgi:environmental stress-induced protein Ves